MSANSHVAKFKGQPLEARLGAEGGAAMRSKLSESGGKHMLNTTRSEEYKAKMRDAWDRKREEWTASIRRSAARPEVKQKQSVAMQNRIEQHGYHLARGRETRLEAHVRQVIEAAGLSTIKQKGTKKATLGKTRFFDLFIPKLNLLVECDGEWWHRTADRIKIDEDKERAAYVEGYEFVRISDMDASTETILYLLNATTSERAEHTNAIMHRRRAALSARGST